MGRKKIVKDVQPIGSFRGGSGSGTVSLGVSGSQVTPPPASAAAAAATSQAQRVGAGVPKPFEKTILQLSLGSPTMPGGVIPPAHRRVLGR